ncbi:tagaturonate epimerase family protein [Ruficoccus sp. ZRK36]|uniref:tagaturonate epimerase family protein n=1 Tax=Ruficoccus sp. ZRK36 TaxID=2866311 RepID=UPI001C72CA58|nr:tagaturonate epimerase family protein [Ruficoccus sp. ZRK36]QYY36670.1 tagaturonate epimerase family protein [Ruficoccus sp. ZRK36]
MVKTIESFTFGMGDRFGHQGQAQLQAVLNARAKGIDIYPVWNKSHREHTIVGTEPCSLRTEADDAVKALDWDGSYYVDADHIRLETVEGFLAGSNFFTLDVADYVGETPSEVDVEVWLKVVEPFFGEQKIEGLSEPLVLSSEAAKAAAAKYLSAIVKAGELFRHIDAKKGEDAFVTEVSIDETDQPQGPADIFYLLSMMAWQQIPAQTVAPKFTGRFNKGVDYVGNLEQFEQEFHADLCIITFAVKEFGLPEQLKISVHSGSDKFSLYPIIKRLIKQHGAGLHVKTAGTTWLEEVIGLARAGGEGLTIAKEIYAKSLAHYAELTAPYSTVIDIDTDKLPSAETVAGWSSEQFVAALEHDVSNAEYNLHLRQLIHVGFKIAAKMGDRYLNALDEHAAIINQGVTDNLYKRHILPIFG